MVVQVALERQVLVVVQEHLVQVALLERQVLAEVLGHLAQVVLLVRQVLAEVLEAQVIVEHRGQVVVQVV